MKRFFSLNICQRGSSLIEVLVTMIVVAVGLLGHAGLIAVSTKDNHAAFMRSQATFLSDDIIERLRLNRTLAVAGSFNIAVGSAVSSGTTIQLNELRDWKTNVSQSLPSGDGSVSVNGSGNVTIVIQWNEVIKGADDGSISPTTFTTQTVI